jgi:hypothetical protein
MFPLPKDLFLFFYAMLHCFRCENGNYDTTTSNCSTQTTQIDGLNRSTMDTADAFGSLLVSLKPLIFP